MSIYGELSGKIFDTDLVVRCPVSCVLNLSIDLNSLTLAKSN